MTLPPFLFQVRDFRQLHHEDSLHQTSSERRPNREGSPSGFAVAKKTEEVKVQEKEEEERGRR